MSLSVDISEEILKSIPSLRAFAISLTGNFDQADDLVQETLVRGISHIDQFQPGTNIQAWLFTILRNQFHTNFRRRRREVEDPEGLMAARLAVLPEQGKRIEIEELRTALGKLPDDQREAILLVGAQGFSYEDAAGICGVPVGTIKSRISRARQRLAELMAIEGDEDMGTDRILKAAMQD
jgi:RNA polymerase sigma-70 factor (ECF subfamily)